jgi:Flp pilus assembly protein TadG
MVEFAMLVPIFMLLLLGLLEFGFVFDQTMTISYATREGARSAAAFASGNTTTLLCADVDKNIVAAVQRVLSADGSRIDMARVSEIRIYRAQTDGTPFTGTSNNNIWSYNPGGGPTVDGTALDFSRASGTWDACTRDSSWTNGAAPDSVGVSLQYSYPFVTPLGIVINAAGNGAGLPISDRTVMALNPGD